MPRRLVTALLCTCLAACEDTLDDRLAELDARATVDCGELGDCNSRAKAEAVVACLRDNLAAGVVGAKAFFILGTDEVAYVYALDGSLVNIRGYYYEGNNFTEYSCRELAVTGFSNCFQAQATECDEIRDWY